MRCAPESLVYSVHGWAETGVSIAHVLVTARRMPLKISQSSQGTRGTLGIIPSTLGVIPRSLVVVFFLFVWAVRAQAQGSGETIVHPLNPRWLCPLLV